MQSSKINQISDLEIMEITLLHESCSAFNQFLVFIDSVSDFAIRNKAIRHIHTELRQLIYPSFVYFFLNLLNQQGLQSAAHEFYKKFAFSLQHCSNYRTERDLFPLLLSADICSIFEPFKTYQKALFPSKSCLEYIRENSCFNQSAGTMKKKTELFKPNAWHNRFVIVISTIAFAMLRRWTDSFSHPYMRECISNWLYFDILHPPSSNADTDQNLLQSTSSIANVAAQMQGPDLRHLSSAKPSYRNTIYRHYVDVLLYGGGLFGETPRAVNRYDLYTALLAQSPTRPSSTLKRSRSVERISDHTMYSPIKHALLNSGSRSPMLPPSHRRIDVPVDANVQRSNRMTFTNLDINIDHIIRQQCKTIKLNERNSKFNFKNGGSNGGGIGNRLSIPESACSPSCRQPSLSNTNSVKHYTPTNNSKPIDDTTAPSILLLTTKCQKDVLICAAVGQLCVALGFSNGTIYVCSLRKDNPISKLKGIDQLEQMDPYNVWQMDLFDSTEKSLTIKLSGHVGPVYCIEFSPVDGFLLSGGRDHHIRLWSIFTRSCVCIYRAHNDAIYDIRYSPFGYYFATASKDGSARVWVQDCTFSLREFSKQQNYHYDEVMCVDFHPNLHYIATGCKDRYVRIFDISLVFPTNDRKTKTNVVLNTTGSGFSNSSSNYRNSDNPIASNHRRVNNENSNGSGAVGRSTDNEQSKTVDDVSAKSGHRSPFVTSQSHNKHLLRDSHDSTADREPTDYLVRMFSGHKAPVLQVRFTDCGQYLVSCADGDNTLLIYSLTWTANLDSADPPTYIVNTIPIPEPSTSMINHRPNVLHVRKRFISLSPADEGSLQLSIADGETGRIQVWNLARAIDEDRNNASKADRYKAYMGIGEVITYNSGPKLSKTSRLLISQQFATKTNNLVMVEHVNRALIIAVGRAKTSDDVHSQLHPLISVKKDKITK